MSCLFWTNSWYARNRVAAKLRRVVGYLQNQVPYTLRNLEAIELMDAARRSVKYDHGIVYAGGLKQFRPKREEETK
jgi:hypothetical protein